MSRKLFTLATRLAGLILIPLAPLTARAAAAQTRSRPNIVFFIADDISIRDSSAYGDTQIPTPNMTALAKDGLTFDLAYATSPSCAPSRAALLTGCYNLRNGVMFNHQRAKPDLKKWPAYFQAFGYEVVAFGKVSHYGHVQTYGFDHAAFYNYHQDVCVDKAVDSACSSALTSRTSPGRRRGSARRTR